MNVLITGASGFLGGHLVERFVNQGYRVRALVRRTSRTDHLEGLGVELCVGSMFDADSLARAVSGVDLVIHAAATMAGTWDDYRAGTIEGTEKLLQLAERAGVKRLVYISSISVYAFSDQAPGRTVTEDSPYETELLTNYSRSKIEAEKRVLAYQPEGGMTVVTIRPGLIYGERGPWNLPRMGYRAGRNRYLIVGRGNTALPVVYVGNLVDAVVKAAEADSERVAGEVVNVLDDELFTQMEWLRRYQSEVNPELRIRRCPYLVALFGEALSRVAGRLLHRPSPIQKSHLIQCHTQYVYSNQKAKELLDWQPAVPVEEALERTMRSLARPPALGRRASIRLLGVDSTTKPPLRVGIVGCGRIAETHLSILAKMGNADVAAVCDLNPEAAAETARRFGVPRHYRSPAGMLEAEHLDVVHVLTPPQSHLEITRLAAGDGCHVYVEKPMAVDAGEAQAMVAAAESAGVLLCVGHNHLYDPVVIEARRHLEAGALGELVCAESYYGFDLSSNRAAVYMTAAGQHHWTFKLPGGLYQNLLPHPLSVLLDVVGEAGEVATVTRDLKVVPYQSSDELRALVQAEKAMGVVSLSLAASPRFQYLNVFGTKATLFVDILNKIIVRQSTAGPVPKALSRGLSNFRWGRRIMAGTLRGMAKVLLGRWTPYDGTEILMREFYSAIHEERPSPSPGEAGVRVMELMDRMWPQVGLGLSERV